MSVFKANTMQQMSFVLRRGLGYSKRRQEKLEWKRRERHKKEERKGKGKEDLHYQRNGKDKFPTGE
jgi:hypothetical protein